MSYLPPAWLIGAQALDAAGDPHLAAGAHYRVSTHPLAGLPLRPLAIYRVNLSTGAKLGKPRTDITWVDQYGRILLPPFTVSSSVTGYLPVGGNTRCVWVKVVADPMRPMRLDAYVDTEYGPALVGTRSTPSFEVGASSIQYVKLSGYGTVTSASWLDPSTLQLGKPIAYMGLPYSDAPRYSGFIDASTRSMKLVENAAPLRLGLHDDIQAADPSSAALATKADEVNRVTAFSSFLENPLKRLLSDMSLPQSQLQFSQTLTDGVPTSSTANVSCIGSVLTSALDPGLGRYLGLLGHDAMPGGVTGDVIVYMIRGFWQLNSSHFTQEQLNGIALASSSRITSSTPPDTTLPFKWPATPADPGSTWSVYDFRIPAAITVGVPSQRPATPLLGPVEHGPGPWMPLPAPQARRELRVQVSSLAPGACVAFVRNEGGTLIRLNERPSTIARAMSMLVAHPPDAIKADTGLLFDRDAPETALGYRVAQADWFGRWSPWSSTTVAARARPLPPVPTLESHYTPATFSQPVPTGKLWGTLSVRVPIPPASELPPGSNLLSTLRVQGTVAGVFVSVDVPLPAPPAEFVTATLPAPLVSGNLAALDRGATATAVLQARWIDTAGQQSALSPTRTVTLVDARPPVEVVIDPSLRYSARPDVTGRARLTLSWPVSPGQKRYRVYFCDETRLVAAVRALPASAQRTSFLDAWTAAQTPAQRAQAFTTHVGLFSRDWFENLTAEGLMPGAGATEMRFQHELSGSLKVLTLFRVVALSDLNAESPWASAPLVPFGVPNSGPPPQPMLELVRPDELPADQPLASGAVRLRVRVIRGSVPAARYRLRRSSVTSSDPQRMLPVAEGNIAWSAGGPDDPPTFELDDLGAIPGVTGATLKPWTRYSWRVEVQGPQEPGSTVPGEWSAASAPVSTLLIPDAPVAPDPLVLVPLGAGSYRVTWHHDEPLQGGSLGGYHFEVYRRRPGDSLETLLGEVAADAPAAEGGRDAGNTFFFTDTGPVDPGTSYRVLVRDPNGRRSPPTSPSTL